MSVEPLRDKLERWSRVMTAIYEALDEAKVPNRVTTTEGVRLLGIAERVEFLIGERDTLKRTVDEVAEEMYQLRQLETLARMELGEDRWRELVNKQQLAEFAPS